VPTASIAAPADLPTTGKSFQFSLRSASLVRAKSWKPLRQNRDFPEPFQPASSVRPSITKISLPFSRKSCFSLRIPLRQRGASRSSRVLERDAVDAIGSPDVRSRERTAKSCGPDPPTLGSSFSRDVSREATVAKKPGTPGRARSSR